MIPIRLQLEGVYSYKEKQEIDFTKLTSSGLFGIFGAVGSGKSTIPESMMLALFGNPERMKLQSNRSSLIHLLTDQLRIEFDFGVGKSNDQIYKAVFSLKRKKKNFEEIDKAEHVFYMKNGSSWEPLQHNDAKRILGLGLEDMRRTMIIPQGKFKEFIELSAADRANMLQDLFGLDAYDLYEDTKRLKSRNFNAMNLLKGELSGIGDVDESIVAAKRESLNIQIRELNQLEINFKELNEKVKKWEQEIKQLQERDALQGKQELLQQEKSRVEEQMEFLRYYEVFLEKLKPQQDHLSALDLTIKDIVKQLDETTKKSQEVESKKQAIEEDVSKLQQKLEGISQKEERLRQLEKVIERNQLNALLASQKSNLDLLNQRLKTIETNGQELQLEFDRIEVERERIKKLMPERSQIIKISGSIQSVEAISRGSEALQERIKRIEEEIAEVKENEKRIEKKWCDTHFSTPLLRHENLNLRLNEIVSLSDQWNEKRTLESFSHLVKEGEPCPLCGSLHHEESHLKSEMLPNPYDEETRKLRELLDECSSDVINYSGYNKQVQKLRDQLNAEQELLKESNEKWKLENDFLTQMGFVDSHEAKNKLKDYSVLSEELDKLDSQESGIKSRDVQRKSDDQKCRLQREEAEKEWIKTETRFHAIEEDLKKGVDDFWRAYLDKGPEEIQRDMKLVVQFIEETKKKHTEAIKEQEKIKGQSAALLALIEDYQKNLEKTNKDHLTAKNRLEQSWRDLNWSARQQELVQQFQGNIQDLRKSVNDFYVEWSTVESRLKDLDLILSASTVSLEHFNELDLKMKEMESRLNELREEIGQLRATEEMLSKSLKRKKEAQQELDQLQVREDRLSELEKLFKGKGFVKYISGFYLEELCHSANKRFSSLTKNRLSIELNDDLEFMVRDYLNGGRLRKLSTLSGGQTFQASLCLALALSERIKNINQSEKSFFFLDEGFGSLDRESLHLVFESLKSLRSENRVVGIISHVEELKQEIEVGLQVELDQERGSIIHF